MNLHQQDTKENMQAPKEPIIKEHTPKEHTPKERIPKEPIIKEKLHKNLSKAPQKSSDAKTVYHKPVLWNEILSYIQKVQEDKKAANDRTDLLIFDGTFGDAGHSLLLLEHFPSARIWATERDPIMCKRAMERVQQKNITIECLSAMNNLNDLSTQEISRIKKKIDTAQVVLWNDNFNHLPSIYKQFGNSTFDFILLDFGLASFHFLEAKRGFSFNDELFDMRLDDTIKENATDIINQLPFDALVDIFSRYGEQKYSKTITRAIIQHRPITSSKKLASIVAQVLNRKMKYAFKSSTPTHPATTIFQALRIYINREFIHNEKAIAEFPYLLKPYGCFAAISFHSLEDRIVKMGFKKIGTTLIKFQMRIKKIEKKLAYASKASLNNHNNHNDHTKQSTPFNDTETYKTYKKSLNPEFLILTEKPVTPTQEEIEKNISSRSALLRVLQRTSNAAI